MEEDEGAPPGWQSPSTPKKVKMESEEPKELVKDEDHSEEESKEIEDDDDDEGGPPPGWQQSLPLLDMIDLPPSSPLPPTPPLPSSPRDLNMEQQDSEDEGPPPGWDNKYQLKEQVEQLVTPAAVSAISSEIKTEDVQQDAQNEDGPQLQAQGHPSPAPERVPSDFKTENDQQDAQDEDGPPPGWGSTPQQQSQAHSSLPSPTVPSGCERKNVKVMEERPQPPSRQQSIPRTKPQISVPKPPMVNNPEMGQMVCGSCRRLLSYPRGARYVECACCLEDNYVLEEHEVGQVVCGGCNVLLMYPYGAAKVKCVNCSTKTEIGDQNRRPPLSEHQRRARRHLKRMHSG